MANIEDQSFLLSGNLIRKKIHIYTVYKTEKRKRRFTIRAYIFRLSTLKNDNIHHKVKTKTAQIRLVFESKLPLVLQQKHISLHGRHDREQ